MSENEKIEYNFIFIGNSDSRKTLFFKKLVTEEYFEKKISTIGMGNITN